MSNKQGKMIGFINWRMRVMLNDGRQMTGQMLAFDKHMNLVLADTEEFRRVKRKQNKAGAPGAPGTTQTIETEEKRTLGLVIIRGAQIISVSAESPPPADPSARLGKSASGGIGSALSAGPGVAKPAGRGAPPPSLAVRLRDPEAPRQDPKADTMQGPAAGVGGGAPPPGFPGFPGGAAPPFGRGGPPPGFPGAWPPPGFPANFTPPNFPPGGGPPGGPPGAGPGAPPGFNPPPRR